MSKPSTNVYGAATPGTPGPQRSLILAGGGMRVAYQAGVLRALFEAGLTFAHADGTSGGTMNLGMLFSGLSPVEMCDRWRTLDVKHFASLMPIEDYLKAWDLPAMGDARGVTRQVFPHLGIDAGKINSATGMQGTFNVCNYTLKTSEVIPHQQIDLDLLVAGISLPIFMPPVEKNGFLYLDSVWIKDANLLEAVRRGSEELWLVWCIGNLREYKNGAFNQYVHMIELSANGRLFEEFKIIEEINARIRAGETVEGHTRPIKLHVIKPEYALPLDPDYFLGHIDAATLIDRGYSDARRYLAAMQPGGLPFQPEVTQMRDDTLGLTFRETLRGGFSWDEADPNTGENKGAKTPMTLHAAIHIHDVHAFVSDPNHTADLYGDLTFAPWGENLSAERGVFNLFCPAGEPDTKLIVYEIGFEHSGRQYYLAGRKEIRSGSSLELVKESTTLYAQLHEGADKTGPVVGAGILHIGASEIVKLVSSMHVTHAESAEAGVEALSDFGRFFLGELWENYHK